MSQELQAKELKAKRVVFAGAGMWGLVSPVISAVRDGFTIEFLVFEAVFAFWCLGEFFYTHVADIFLGRRGGEHVMGPKWLSWLWRGTWNPPWLWLAFPLVNASAFVVSLIKRPPLTVQLLGLWGIVFAIGQLVISLYRQKA